jgi:CDP-diacylglycerol---glycerol-3-phosphate 3-phosphatidyltransferase
MATLTPPRPPRERILNLPNQVTGVRLVLSFVLFGLIAAELWLWCLVVLALCAFTDWLDGFLARIQKQTSALGRVFDPLVDKVMTCGAFIYLLPHSFHDGWLTPGMVTVVIAREFLVTGLRGYLESIGVGFGADWLGKLKTVLQFAALVAIFVVQWLALTGLWALMRDILIWAMLAATVLSGLQYLLKGVAFLRTTPEQSSL